MPTLRLTKEFRFEMAHALDGYDGLCKNLHGHSYRLFVTVSGEPKGEDGMVMDFKELKRIVEEEIIDRLDHSLLIWEKSPSLDKLIGLYERINIVDYRPTSENMIMDFVERISGRLPEGVRLQRVRLFETEKSCAEWDASDNL